MVDGVQALWLAVPVCDARRCCTGRGRRRLGRLLTLRDEALDEKVEQRVEFLKARRHDLGSVRLALLPEVSAGESNIVIAEQTTFPRIAGRVHHGEPMEPAEDPLGARRPIGSHRLGGLGDSHVFVFGHWPLAQ